MKNDLIQQAVSYIQTATDFKPEVGMILGSGLGDYADRIKNPVIIPYSDIPGFPISTVVGHAGRFVMGEHLGQKIIAMQGRTHAYEGYSQDLITSPIRIMYKLGVRKLLVTNSAGGVNLSFNPGTLMMISDHINYSGGNPLTGPNLDEYGPRFPDMTQVYDKGCRKILKNEALQADIQLAEGIYMMFGGPCYETPAEVRMARTLGADAVGMSTVPEAIVARHCGMSILGISCITNLAAGILDQPLNHAEVVETANRVKETFIQVLNIVLEKVFS